MTSSTDTRVVIVLGDKDTGTRLEMLETRATECGVAIAETHTFEGSEAAQQDNVADIDAAFTALCQAVRNRSSIWLPFPLDLIREEHPRRLSLVLQRHGLELLIGRNMWTCPRDSGISEIDGALQAALADRERALLAGIPHLLERRFEALRRSATDDAPAWMLPGGWLASFRAELLALLEAELELRLQPVTGLMETLEHGMLQHAKHAMDIGHAQ